MTPEELAQLKAAADAAGPALARWKERGRQIGDDPALHAFYKAATPDRILALLAQAQRDAEAVARLKENLWWAVQQTSMAAAEFFSHESDGLSTFEQIEMAQKIEMMASASLEAEGSYAATLAAAESRYATAEQETARLREALRELLRVYVTDMHGEETCDCDPSVGLDTCAPCIARAALAPPSSPLA